MVGKIQVLNKTELLLGDPFCILGKQFVFPSLTSDSLLGAPPISFYHIMIPASDRSSEFGDYSTCKLKQCGFAFLPFPSSGSVILQKEHQ
jgi:hypothetical protein